MFDLTGRVAVVTGSSRGLGRLMSLALARAGADVVVTARRVADTGATVAEVTAVGRRAKGYALEVRDRNSVAAFCGAVLADWERVDILVNNAGCNVRKPFLEITWDDFDTVLETNLRSGFFVTQGLAPGMIAAGYGRVINIGSVTSVFGMGAVVPYAASRGAVLQMTRSLADALGGHGITVNCLAPGWFSTEQTKVLFENEDWYRYILDRIPSGRVGAENDLDGAVVFLAAAESAYVNGQILLVDGGISTGATRAAPGPSSAGSAGSPQA